MNCFKCLLPLGEGSFGHYGTHSECFTAWFKTSSDAVFTALERKASVSYEESIDMGSHNNSFFHGKFKKYSAVLAGQSFILKMRQEQEAPELPEVEYVCNQIGHELGIPVPKHYIINFEGDAVFLTKNFIHNKIPMDLQHICNFRESAQHNCQDLISIVKTHTKRLYDVEILVKTILFDALIGNHDRHGRNLAFLVTSNKKSLAPIYDNGSYLSLESGNMLKADFNPTGKIATKASQEPTMKDYVIELRRLGFENMISRFFGTLKSKKMKKIHKLIDNSFCTVSMREALRKLIDKRYRELQNEFET